jgi:hypothetical protein
VVTTSAGIENMSNSTCGFHLYRGYYDYKRQNVLYYGGHWKPEDHSIASRTITSLADTIQVVHSEGEL